jgi:hypothetical protein
MLRADRNTATLAGLICAAAGIKGSHGKVLTAADFDPFNRNDEPAKELTVAEVMAVLSRKKR